MEYDSTFMQITFCFIASGSTISSGMNMAYPAVAIPAINGTKNVSDIIGYEFDNSKAFLIASLPQITMTIGCLAAGPILDWKGRKIGLLISTFLASAGWLLIASVSNLWAIYCGRLLTGLAMGFAGPSESVFVSEIASPQTRSALTVIKIVAFSIGVTLTYLFGFFYKTEWKIIALFCGFFPICSFALVYIYLPEPKMWKKRTSIDKINLFRPEVVKPMIIMVLTLSLRQMSGTTAIIAYAVEFASKANIESDAHMIAVILGLTRLAGGLLTIWLGAELGRRLPAIWTGIGMSICMIVLSTSFELPAFALIMYVLTSTVYSAVPQAMAPEVFPTDVRGIATSITNITMYVMAVLALWAHHQINYDKEIMFLYYGCLSAVSTFCIFFFLPETHGKTLDEIGYIFNKDLEEKELKKLKLETN